jgi:hypothetical protein
MKILYWPGMGQKDEILKNLKDTLAEEHDLDTIDFEYDTGILNPENWTILKKKYDWWIGISLGASLLYYTYNFISEDLRPQRLTIINPFSSREVLSKEKEFDISNQWNFTPKSQNIIVNRIELIASVYDSKISPYHGIELINKASSQNKKIIFVNSDHTIGEIEAQYELSKVLLNEENENERFDYCYIYK